MEEEKKKRGRPPLSPEEKEKRRVAKNAASTAHHKRTGWAAQYKYKKEHPEKCREYNKRARENVYEPKIRLPLSKKQDLQSILESENLSITQLFCLLVKEKYGIELLKKDKEDM